MTTRPLVSLPVAVVMARRTVKGKGWHVPSWRVAGLVAGANIAEPAARGTPIRTDGDEEQFLWGGMQLDTLS